MYHKGCPDPTHTHRADQTARSSPDFSSNRCSCGLVTGFCAQDSMPASQVAGLLLQNPSHPTWPTPARSSLDLRKSGKNSTVFGKIELRFEEIRPNPSNFQRKKCRIQRENAKSGEYFQNPTNFSKFW